jgi:hypothetical protein
MGHTCHYETSLTSDIRLRYQMIVNHKRTEGLSAIPVAQKQPKSTTPTGRLLVEIFGRRRKGNQLLGMYALTGGNADALEV